MTWALTASGGTPDADTEALLIADLRQVFATDVGAGTATLVTSFHGTVDLLQPDPADADAPVAPLAEADAEGGTDPGT